MEIVIVEIDPDANITVSADGVSGPGCKALTEAIERALGRTVDDNPTPAFFQEADAGHVHRHG
ncbi:DUF2997 domain-containing protein [Longimicrobium terrae]|uniref:DUF2997 domain-containing protein n=1 Tax=Longimicrobium terrae TaxID=1639882 RepID=A0A841GWP3_9BACT|nr:DUF2997 domain-containing protein [Longimicrobium terrae]MBB4635928.1 hypothetical protein [Longimicrobium terrae]MBB6070324.1 hypothetical protein [Longimicrobium terrae]NNC30825.1 DUF2997 domain-containing protein [Longimicrobium terrae]